MSKNGFTCDFMDEAPGHAHDGTETEHEPHTPEPVLGQTIEWEDGDIQRTGNPCAVCHHVVSDYLWHTDDRLNIRVATATR